VGYKLKGPAKTISAGLIEGRALPGEKRRKEGIGGDDYAQPRTG
jgi:hypothetical protein